MKFKTQGVKMKNIFRYLTLATIVLFGVSSIYAGGGKRTGTAGASQLLVPVGPRGIAMGESNVASATGLEALFWNPAGVAVMDNSASLTFSHQDYIADIGVEYGAVSAKFEGFGVLAFSIKSLGIGDIPVTTTVHPDGTGQTFSPRDLVAGVTYAKRLTDKISVGFTANLVSETIDQVSASGFAFNVGVMYQDLADINGLSFGVVVKNFGPQETFDGPGLLTLATITDQHRPPNFTSINSAAFDLPASFELGLSYAPQIDEHNSLLLTSLFQNNNFSEDTYKFGLEYGYDNILFIRGGYQLQAKASETFIYDYSAGVGLNYDLSGISLEVDYAYKHSDFFGGNHIFGVSFKF